MPQKRVAKELNPSLRKRVAVYALAGAAGLPASAPDVNAAIVYASVKQFAEGQFNHPAEILIDLNRDGVVDFDLMGLQYSLFTGSFDAP